MSFSGWNAQVTGRDDAAELREELLLGVHNVVDATIGRVLRFNVPKDHYRAIGAATAKFRDYEFLVGTEEIDKHTQRDPRIMKTQWHRGK